MNYELAVNLAALWCAVACVFYSIQSQRVKQRNRRIEQGIRKLYDEANWQSEPVYQILQIADLLGVDLDAKH